MSTIAVNAITDANAGNTTTINGVTPNVNNVLGKNRIINGNFDFWQRGTTASYSVTSSQYLADRWLMRTTATANVTTSRQSFTLGQTDVPNNPKYFYRWDITSHTAGTGILEYRIEDVSTFAGNTCTLSFYAKCNTPQTLSNSYLQVFGTGGSADVTTSGSSFSLTTAWQKFTATFTLPSISGKTIAGGNDHLGLRFIMPATVCTVDIAQVQLEAGESATEFEHRPYTTELQLCQRYYEVTSAYFLASEWYASGGSQAQHVNVGYAVAKRTTPTVVLPSTTASVNLAAQPVARTQSTDSFGLWAASAAAGFTYWLYDASKFVTSSAEL